MKNVTKDDISCCQGFLEVIIDFINKVLGNLDHEK